MRYYLKNLYPVPLVADMLHMTRHLEPAEVMDVIERDQWGDELEIQPVKTQRVQNYLYRHLAFSFTRNDAYWRDGDRVITSREAFIEHLFKRGPDQVHFGKLQLYDELGHETLFKQELVFDIDVTDYTCYCECGARSTEQARANNCKNSNRRHTYYCECTGSGQACSTCWLHIEGAALLLHDFLVHRLGIPEKHLLWVLSGKKGIHCLVNDPRYVTMALSERAQLFSLLQCSTPTALREFGRTLAKDDARSTVVQQWETHFFDNVVQRRHMLMNKVFAADCLDLVRLYYQPLHDMLRQSWSTATSSLSKWQSLKRLEQGQQFECPPSLLIVLQYYYPRIDRGPLCEKNHVIKLPFSVHRSTKNIALPVHREEIARRSGLPLQSLTLKDALDYHEQNATLHPDFAAACHIFEQWIGAF
jgi:DNA primase catalytic subunit